MAVNVPQAPVMEPIDNTSPKWLQWFDQLVRWANNTTGLTTTQTFKDGAGATITVTITNGLITKIV
jgi:hypothetical protein